MKRSRSEASADDKMSSKVFLTFLFVLMGTVYAGEVKRRLSNDICRVVMETTEALNHADKSFIFRCRPGDNCGGIGDRLGGVMGGAFYALKTGRSFRILWPGLEHVFKPGHSNWTFDGPTLGVPYENEKGEEIDKTRVSDVMGNQVYFAFPPRTDIGAVNDLNTRQVDEPEKSAQIDKFKHVFFHSNRGPTRQIYTEISNKYGWTKHFPDNDDSYAAVYLCVFEGLFRPTDEFLHSNYKAINHASVPYSHMIRILEDPKFTSMAFHHRVDDDAAATGSAVDTIGEAEMSRMVALSEKHRVEGKAMNLFFITNSNSSAHKVVQHAGIQKAFHAVYSQELTATIHVNMGTGSGEHATSSAVLSTLQAMRDWWIMRLVSLLICPQSGFSKSAALLAPAAQIRYEDEGNAYRANYWTMCGNRFC
jgi:hypothetical protein